jgi:transposase
MASPAIRAYARAGGSPNPPRNPPRNPSPQTAPPRPLPQDAIDHGNRFSIAQRAQCLTLLAEGFSGRDIEKKTGIKPSAQTYMKKKAFDRGFRPDQDPRILDYYVIDGVHSGRPKEITVKTEQRLLNSVRADRAGREKSSEVLAYECGISYSSAVRILHKHGLNSVKPTRKPGLNPIQRKARLEFCLQHQHWTLEDWKRVIWSDETSVILGQRRGTIRIWRDNREVYNNTAIRNRWKGFSEFMFWGCFSWDKKGPCHIWTKETAQEKKQAQEELDNLNEALEDQLQAEWELVTGIRRLDLRQRKSGPRPKWRFTKANGKLIRDSQTGGIDWYRYLMLFSLFISTNSQI